MLLWPEPPDPADVLLNTRLPLAPVSKERARVAVNGNRRGGYTPQKTADFEAQAGMLMLARWRGPKPCRDLLGIRAVFHTASPTADGDNMLKALLDAGNKRVWVDDRQFVVFVVTVTRKAPTPGIDVVVWRHGTVAPPARQPARRGTGHQPRRPASPPGVRR